MLAFPAVWLIALKIHALLVPVPVMEIDPMKLPLMVVVPVPSNLIPLDTEPEFVATFTAMEPVPVVEPMVFPVILQVPEALPET